MKNKVKLPEIYELLSKPTKQIAERKVVIDATGKVYIFPNAASVLPPEIVPDKEWKNFEELLTGNAQTAIAYHEQLMGPIPKKKQQHTETCEYLWAWMVKNGTPIIETATVNAAGDVEKARKSSLNSRKYFIKSTDTGALKTRQAVVCYNILKESLSESGSVTEEQLKANVIRRADELKTKQDPWRIFQYYRPTLIKLNLIRYE